VRSAILAVGTELLGADRADTNSLRLSAVLADFGVAVQHKSVVGDDEAAIAREVSRLADEHDLVLLTGGLGPTADDVTREAVAAAAGRRLVHDPALEAELRQRFARFLRRMPETNLRQAAVIEGATLLPNRRGTAPALTLPLGSATLFLFPGVPFELEGLIAEHLVPWLARRTGGHKRETATLKVACVPESEVDERLQPAYAEFGREPITVLCSPGEVRVRMTATGDGAGRAARLQAMTARVRQLLGPEVFAATEAETLEEVVGVALRAAQATVATAESCTGGLIAERLTRIAGASDYLLGGVVAYSNALKTALLGVSQEILAVHGAVSEPVARAMAEGVVARTGARFGLAVTGIAGPGGGSEEKPVGSVHLALFDAAEPRASVHHLVRFPGDRERIRWQTSQLALDLLRRRLVAAGSR